jgi:hypothetical protein
MAAKETLISSFDIQENRASRSCALFLCATLVALFLLAMPAISAAQTAGTGALSGTVTDQSGSSVGGAQVKVTSEASGEVRTVTTNATGYFVVPLLLPGTYRVEVSQTGFRSVNVPHVNITVTETNALTIRLEVGQIAETVVVEAQVAQLQTESSTLGRVTSSEQVEALPLAMRNFTQIIALNPGVSAEIANAGELGRGGGGNNQDPTVSAGNWASDNNFQMNGIGDNDIQQSGYFSAGVAIPNPDTIQEFKVQTGQYDASYGRNAGANVDVITKGGTNAYHGAAWEYFRNNDMNANTFFGNSHDQPRAILKQNQFGGDFGGPIKRDKLQFFTSYQGTRQRNGLDLNCSSTIQEAPITNDRSQAALGALFAGQSGAFGGPTINADGSNINPVALALLNTKLPNGQYLMPSAQTINPSLPFDSQGSLSFSVPCPFTEDQFMTNADYEMSSKSKLSARFFFANSITEQTLPQTNLTGGGSPPGAPVDLTQDFRNFSLTHTYIISPTLLNEAEVGYHRIFATFTQSPPGFTWSGVGATVVPEDNDIPVVAIDGGGPTGLSLGGNGQNVQIAENTYTFQDSVSWTHGKHNFRFGAGLMREQNNQVGFHYLAGALYLTWADFMLGQPGTPVADGGTGVSNVFLSVDLLGQFDRAYRDWEVWDYVQDDFKVTKRLTLNLGLRYDRIGDFGDAQGRNAGFDSTLANPNPPAAGTLAGTTLPNNYVGTIPAGVKQLNNDFGLNGDGQNTWNPRLGLAYQMPWTHDRVVIRAGYGVYHSRSTGQPFLQLISAPPYGQIREFEGASAISFSSQQPLPLDAPTFPTFVPYSPTTSNAITMFEPAYRPPMIQEYSFGTQTQLTPSLVLEVGYSGARGLHLISERSINQADLASPSDPIRGQTTNTVANIPLRVPFEGFSSNSMQQIGSSGASWYNALLVSLNKRFSHGLAAQVSYTFSKDMSTSVGSTTGANGGSVVGNQNVPSAGYGLDNFIRPNRLIVNYSYELPKLHSENTFVQQVVNGWSLQGVTTFQTGHYLSILYSNGTNVYGITSDRAQLSGTCTPGQYVNSGSVTSKLTSYINTSCFTTPPVIGDDGVATGFGNSGVGILQGPGELNFDFSLIKNFPVHKIRDSANLQFRAEFFNIFNHPLFQDPDTNLTDATFGQITNTYGNPRIVQLALKLSF